MLLVLAVSSLTWGCRVTMPVRHEANQDGELVRVEAAAESAPAVDAATLFERMDIYMAPELATALPAGGGARTTLSGANCLAFTQTEGKTLRERHNVRHS